MAPSGDALQSFQAMDAAAQSMPGNPPLGETVSSCPLKKKIRLRIVVRDPYYRLCQNRDYALTVGGEVLRGNTGPKALVDQLVEKGAASAELQVRMDDDANTVPLTWHLKIDDIDPLALDTGAETRLRNLGVAWAAEQSGEPAVRAKLEEFQAAFKLESKGDTLDAATRAELDHTYSGQPIDTVKRQYFIWDETR